MIHVIGNIAINIDTQLDQPLNPNIHNKATSAPMLDLAGHGALQAISAARCGAKVSLISKIGTDLLGKYALDILRKESVQTSSLSKETEQSELTIALNSPDQKTHISAPESQTHLQTNIIPAEHFNARNLIVISSDLPANSESADWLKKVKDNGARIMLCLQPGKDINQDLTPYADIIICDETIALPALCENTHIINTKDFGAEENQGSTVSFDIFCGYFAACLQAGLPLERSLKIANNAAALSTQQRGTYRAIPHLGYLEDILEEEPI